MIHYTSDGIFDASVENIWNYMTAHEHRHAAFKSYRVVQTSGNQVTVEAEIYNPDKTTQNATIKHTMNPPKGFETTISGGPMDGARFSHVYTPMGDKAKVDLEGDFRPIAGMQEADQRKMLDDFFTMAFNEDNANLQKIRQESSTSFLSSLVKRFTRRN
jgi:ligand-binding SRPBCC domain-containing protein